jgi:hypothetical protein
MTALSVQRGGDHYLKLPIQPFEFTLRNGWDGAAHSIVKYLTRYRDKGGILDLQKALHIAEIRSHLLGPWLLPTRPMHERMRMVTYTAANGINGQDEKVLMQLEEWVDDYERKESYDIMVADLHRLIAEYTLITG